MKFFFVQTNDKPAGVRRQWTSWATGALKAESKEAMLERAPKLLPGHLEYRVKELHRGTSKR